MRFTQAEVQYAVSNLSAPAAKEFTELVAKVRSEKAEAYNEKRERVRKLLSEHGMTQNKLAEGIGRPASYTRSVLSGAERNEGILDAALLFLEKCEG